MDELEPGLQHTDTIEVTSTLTAVAHGSGDVEVLATPAVLALAEGACVSALADNLPEGQTSVGTHVELEHTRATPVGRTVIVDAELVGQDGRQLEFEVTVREDDQVVATVRHRRAVVDRQRFLEQAGITEA